MNTIFLGLRSKDSRSRKLRVLLCRIPYVGLVAAGTVLSSGCTTIDQIKTDVRKAISSESAPGNSSRTAAQSALTEGIDLYDKGDFNGAIRRLSNAPEIWSSDKAVQTKALKYMAFSYCVTSRPALCRQQFERALKADPNFDLSPGEKGHPLWDSVFERAKKPN